MNTIWALTGVVIGRTLPTQGFLCPVCLDGAHHGRGGFGQFLS